MTPAQHSAYLAICQADPECLIKELDLGDTGSAVWRTAPHHKAEWVPQSLAEAAITDRLGMRMMQVNNEQRAKPRDRMLVDVQLTREGNWCAVRKMYFEQVQNYLGPSKLSAYLAAHIVRLSLPRELIDAMENDNA